MKQDITAEQWAEACRKGQDYTIEFEGGSLIFEDTSIGGMIEFLGDDLEDMTNCGGDWHIYLDDEPLEPYDIVEKELVDALWEAVKYKLNNL